MRRPFVDRRLSPKCHPLGRVGGHPCDANRRALAPAHNDVNRSIGNARAAPSVHPMARIDTSCSSSELITNPRAVNSLAVAINKNLVG